MKKLNNLFIISLLLIALSSCNNADRYASEIWDSSLPMEIAHGGEFKGYVHVFTIDWLEGSYDMSSDAYKVYKKSNGDNVIDYDGNEYLRERVSEPLTAGISALKWKFDYNHYIEDIPTSW